MLNIEKKQEGNELTFALEGRLDTTTSPELETQVKGGLDGVELLVFDLAKLDYISSTGLRVLLTAQKLMMKKGKMVVRNASEEVNEIFEVTGFSEILNIE